MCDVDFAAYALRDDVSVHVVRSLMVIGKVHWSFVEVEHEHASCVGIGICPYRGDGDLAEATGNPIGSGDCLLSGCMRVCGPVDHVDGHRGLVLAVIPVFNVPGVYDSDGNAVERAEDRRYDSHSCVFDDVIVRANLGRVCYAACGGLRGSVLE